jgi:copper chaperone CopZ
VNGVKRTVLAISGMRGNSCRERVAEALGRVEGVLDVTVSLVRARAEVVHLTGCCPEELVRAVIGVGYAAEFGGGEEARRA